MPSGNLGARAVLEDEGVDGARLLMDESGRHFGASIGIYESLFRKSGVVTHEALASLLKKWYKSEVVRDEVEAMWEAEVSVACIEIIRVSAVVLSKQHQVWVVLITAFTNLG